MPSNAIVRYAPGPTCGAGYGIRAVVLILVIAACGLAATSDAAAQAPSGARGIPRYVNDPAWPKPLPNHWVIGQVGGLAVDGHDHIWVLQRALPYAIDEQGRRHELTLPERMPAVLEFDTAGSIVRSWGGQGYVPDWPRSEHALWVDQTGNVWIGGNAPGDRQVLKFSADGRPLLEIGHPTHAPRDNADTGMLGEPAGIEVDSGAHEVYIADGYLNSRIVVYDSDTGKFKRGWGAYRCQRSRTHPSRPETRSPQSGTTCAKGRTTCPASHPSRSSAPRCIAFIGRQTATSTSVTGATTGSRCSTNRGSSCGNSWCIERRGKMVRSGR